MIVKKTKKDWVGSKYTIKLSSISEYEDYVIYNVLPENPFYNSTRIIKNAEIRRTEGSTNIEAIGKFTATKLTLTILDTDLNSPLCYNDSNNKLIKLLSKEVVIERKLIDIEGNEDDGFKFYIDSHNIVDNQTVHETITITALDKLDYIMDTDVKDIKIKALNGTIEDITDRVFNYFNLKYKYARGISRKLRLKSVIGVTESKKVRDLLESVCSILQCRMVVNRKDEVLMVPALSDYDDSGLIGGLTWTIRDPHVSGYNKGSGSSSEYSGIQVVWNDIKGNDTDVLLSISGINIPAKVNVNLRGLSLSGKALSIDSCRIRPGRIYDEDGDEIRLSSSLNGYQDGVDINITNYTVDANGATKKVDNIRIDIIGHKMIYNDEEENAFRSGYSIDNISKKQYRLPCEFIFDKETATIVANKHIEYMNKMDTELVIETDKFSPWGDIGDIANLISDMYSYSAIYKITELIFRESVGGDYSHRIKLIYNKELSEQIYSLWDDTLIWDDTIIWDDEAIAIINVD